MFFIAVGVLVLFHFFLRKQIQFNVLMLFGHFLFILTAYAEIRCKDTK